MNPAPPVTASGTLIRKRALSKRLLFLDLQVDTGRLSVCVKDACGGVGSAAEARTSLKLGDVLLVTGTPEPDGAVLARDILITLAWREAGDRAPWPGPPPSLCEASGSSASGQVAGGAGTSTPSTSADGATVAEDVSPGACDAASLAADICPFFVNTGKCPRPWCELRHTSGDIKAERREWVRARRANREQLAVASGDPTDPHDKASNAQRASVFAAWLLAEFGRETLSARRGVLDVAGGRGALSCELGFAGVVCTLIDERRAPALDRWQWKRLKKMQQRATADQSVSSLPPAAEASREGACASPDAGSSGSGSGLPLAAEASREGACASPDAGSSGGEAAADPSGSGLPLAAEASREGACASPDAGGSGGEGSPGHTPRDGRRAPAPVPAAEPPLPFAHLQQRLDARFELEHGALLHGASAIVGMHPDEATEPIIDTALRLGVPFAVVPCCVFARALPKFLPGHQVQVTTYEQLLAYLQAKHPAIQRAHLPFTGRNVVLFWDPAKAREAKAACAVCDE